MVRNLFALSLMGILAVASGCSMCSDCTDEAPNYSGGIRGNEDMRHGRVGSAFTGVTVAQEHATVEGEQVIESGVYNATHQEPADETTNRAVRRAGLTEKDIQETSARPIATEGLELTDADFDFENLSGRR